MNRALPACDRRCRAKNAGLQRLRRPGGERDRPRQLPLEPPDLPQELVALLAGEPGEVGVPGRGQVEDRAAFLDGGGGPEPVGRRERGKQRRAGGGGADRVEVPGLRRRRAALEQSRPHILLEAGGSDQVEVVGDVHAAHEAVHALPFLVEGKESGECSRIVGDAKEVQGPPAEEGARPCRLPLPGEEDRRMIGASEERVPAFLVERLEARKRLNLHRRSRRPTGSSRPRRSRPHRGPRCAW